MALLPAFVGRFGPASGPGGSRRVWLATALAGVVLVGFVATAVYRTQPRPSVLPKVPQTQTGVGLSGSDQQRRSNIQQEEAEAAIDAHNAGRTSMLSLEDSYEQQRQSRNEAAARKQRTTASPARAPQRDDNMTRGFLVALNRAMAGMSSVSDTTENFNEKDIAKERAEERESFQKVAASSGEKASEMKQGKHGLGLAGQRVMARTVLAATMDADSNGRTPAVVKMTSGPLAGYRLQGTIEKHDSGLSIPMDVLYYVEGQKIPVKAVLVSPQTQEVSVACDVDHHYLVRIGVPAIAGAVQGLGQAAQESGSTVAAGPYGGVASYNRFSPWQIAGTAAGGAAAGAQSVLRDALPKGSTVTLCADVPVEVYFEDDVYLSK